MIVNHWPPWFRRLYGGEWPTSYVCIDTETSGYQFDRDVITQWGHVLVEDGQVVDQLSLVIDWTDHPVVPDHWLRKRLTSLEASMELGGSKCQMTYHRIKAEGMKPDRALAFIRDFTATLLQKRMIFVAHGGVFDEKMIAGNLIGFNVARTFSFGDNGLLDTEAIEKASQCLDNSRMYPKQGDTLRSYFHRVKYTRVNGCKSNLDTHCFKKYALDTKGVDRKKLHDAEVDAFATHILMEEFRAQITDPVPPPVFQGATYQQAPETRAEPPPQARPQLTGQTRYRGQRRT